MKYTLLPGSKIEIRHTSSLNNKKSYGFISQIEECIDEKTLVIGAPISGGKIITLQKNTEYTIFIYSSTGIYRCNAVIKNSFKNGLIQMLKIELISPLVKTQRREFFRFDCVIPFKFKINDVWEKGIIKDISGGGIRFISNSLLKTPEEIVLILPLDEHDLTIEGTLLRKEESNIELYKYQYRVSFNEIKKSDQDIIIQFIFMQQRKKVRQEKGL